MTYRTTYKIMDKISTTCTLRANFTRISEFHTRSVFYLRKSANFTGEVHLAVAHLLKKVGFP